MTMMILIAILINTASASTGLGENHDRQVDQAALDSQSSAELKLKVLLRKYAHTAQEAVLLLRLAEIEQESAAIEFRIAYGQAHQKKAAPKLEKYNTVLKATVKTL